MTDQAAAKIIAMLIEAGNTVKRESRNRTLPPGEVQMAILHAYVDACHGLPANEVSPLLYGITIVGINSMSSMAILGGKDLVTELMAADMRRDQE